MKITEPMEQAQFFVLQPLPLPQTSLDAPHRISKAGHVYQPGKVTDNDLRQKIIQVNVERGGDSIASFFLGNFTQIARINQTILHCEKEAVLRSR